MANTIFIRNKRVCVRPLRSQIKAIQKLKLPTMIKECCSFVGMVNFVSIFCPELQKLLKPIYFFGRKNNKRPLTRSNIDHKDPQSYIYPIDMDDSSYIQTRVSSPLVVHYTKFKMDNQGSLLMPVRECQRQQRIRLGKQSHCLHCLLITLTKDSPHVPFLSPELTKVELD